MNNGTKTGFQKKSKKKIVIAIISVVALAGVIVLMNSILNGNRADRIYENFKGLSLSGMTEDDDGFANAYYSGTLNSFMTYWKTVERRTLVFNDNGTVTRCWEFEHTALAHPKSISEPRSTKDHGEDTVPYSVRVSFGGTVFLRIGSSSTEYEVYVDGNDVPRAIYDYLGMTMD